ncbi:hypothetical protein ACFL6N_06015 [Thermodesulfobacteriota bacterium]
MTRKTPDNQNTEKSEPEQAAADIGIESPLHASGLDVESVDPESDDASVAEDQTPESDVAESDVTETEVEEEEESQAEISQDIDEYDSVPVHLRVYSESDAFSRSRMPKTVHWSVVWSDLMMTMFIMFAVMYMYQMAHRSFLGEEEDYQGRFGAPGEKSILDKGGGGPIDPSGPLEGSIAKIYDMSRETLDAHDLREFGQRPNPENHPDRRSPV